MLPDNITDAEVQKFLETSDNTVGVRIVLHPDSYTLLDARYVKIDTGTPIENSTETSNAATQLNALLAQLRTVGLLAPTT